jgi:hypothetical protein
VEVAAAEVAAVAEAVAEEEAPRQLLPVRAPAPVQAELLLAAVTGGSDL